MRAMQYLAYGGPERLALRTPDAPRPSPTQLLVRVHASSVNPLDWKLHNGTYRWVVPVHFPSIPGFDIAGEVIEVGVEVSRFKPGDRVFAMLDSRTGGACAEYVVIGESAAARVPDSLDVREAAAVPLAGLTALQALRDLGRVGSGQHVLVVGGSGGVGHFAVQIARAFDARVTAVCSTPNVEMVRRLGADRVIDYRKQRDFGAAELYDVIFDTVASAPVRAFLPFLAKKGVVVSTLPSVGRIAAVLLMPLYSKRRVRIVAVEPRGKDLEKLAILCAEGKLRPVIDRVVPLEDLAVAHRYSQAGRTSGKVVITLS
jgi:2-desacetyl-2-hydroxyethyl bacteriochlorophyllide A dehydrogenase